MKFHFISRNNLQTFEKKYPKLSKNIERSLIKYENYPKAFKFTDFKNRPNKYTRNNPNFKVITLILSSKDDFVGILRYYWIETDILFNVIKVKTDIYLKIDGVLVHPKYRRQGICKKMIKKVIENTSNKIFLRVENNNIPARKCYLSQGFQEIGKFDNDLIMLKN